MKGIKISDVVVKLHKDLQNEKGEVIIPKEWEPILNLLVFALKALKLFTSDDVDKIIDILIYAIEKYLQGIPPK
jgi:hypothetical protein